MSNSHPASADRAAFSRPTHAPTHPDFGALHFRHSLTRLHDLTGASGLDWTCNGAPELMKYQLWQMDRTAFGLRGVLDVIIAEFAARDGAEGLLGENVLGGLIAAADALADAACNLIYDIADQANTKEPA